MDALGIAVGIVLISILVIAGINMPDYLTREQPMQIFYLVLAILAASVAILVFREADL